MEYEPDLVYIVSGYIIHMSPSRSIEFRGDIFQVAGKTCFFLFREGDDVGSSMTVLEARWCGAKKQCYKEKRAANERNSYF